MCFKRFRSYLTLSNQWVWVKNNHSVNIESPVPGTGFSVVLIHISEVLFNTLTHSHLLCDNNFTYVLLVKASLAINSSLGPKISGFLLIFFFLLFTKASSEWACFNDLLTHLSTGLKCQDSNFLQIISLWFCSTGP